MTGLLTYDENHVPLYPELQRHLKYADVLLDIGAGVRPQRFVKCDRHVCLEPHAEYCDVLRDNGFEVIQAEAPAGLAVLDPVDSVTCIDVIEHLSRDDGLLLIEEMKRLARGQVLVFTPLGFMPQEGGGARDPWGYQGQHWQEHRSGWTPQDFPGWRTFVDPHFHQRDREYFGAFFALWG